MPEIYVVVALAFAVFAAVSAVGSAIVLGIGYERLRFGLERVKEGLDLVGRQSSFFSGELHRLDQKLENVEVSVEQAQARAKTKSSKKSKSKSSRRGKKTKLPEVAQQEALQQEEGSISISMGMTPSNDMSNNWASLQDLAREEALASFAQMGVSGTDSKIRYM